MDLKDQLRNIFPNHKFSEISNSDNKKSPIINKQSSPLICKYEKRNGRPNTIIEGFENINNHQIKSLAKKIKQVFSVGGSVKQYSIIIQGNIRNEIMSFLKSEGYNVKRVGG